MGSLASKFEARNVAVGGRGEREKGHMSARAEKKEKKAKCPDYRGKPPAEGQPSPLSANI